MILLSRDKGSTIVPDDDAATSVVASKFLLYTSLHGSISV